jgi:pteridine reductase
MAEHKVALVTGSGKKRVGWHVASALAERGYAVVLHYHSSAQEAAESLAALRARGVPAQAVQADLGDEAAVDALFDEALRHFGRLDVLVNAAGLWKQRRLEEVRADDVRRHFDANVLGTFLCGRRAGLIMVGQPEGGCIVNLGDWAEARPYLHYAAYFASKGAITALTRCLAVELGTRNPRVRVNCINPGPVLLPPDLPQEERQQAIASTLVQREGSPENVARAVLCLVDNDFITGACLTVDGGRTIYAGGS